MYISFISFVVRAIKSLLTRAAASAEQLHANHAIIAHYAGRRWCDATERALNEELIGRGSWLGNRFESQNDLK